MPGRSAPNAAPPSAACGARGVAAGEMVPAVGSGEWGGEAPDPSGSASPPPPRRARAPTMTSTAEEARGDQTTHPREGVVQLAIRPRLPLPPHVTLVVWPAAVRGSSGT